GWLKANNCDFSLAFMYRTASNDVKDVLTRNEYDVICFFTPSGVKSLFDNVPKYKQNGTVIGAFGNNTSKAIEEAGLKLGIKAPEPQAPSMVAALEKFLAAEAKKK
ncbi:MAG TPA: uroporphyrinogen-III synthase, partial [Flavisolibacter sp.]